MLKLTQLRSFVVAAEELNFSKAAQRLFLTQPALSIQIRLLEESCGQPLFVRAQRALRLTSAGALLLDEARTLLAHAERVEEILAQRGDSGTIAVGVGVNLAESIHRVGIEHLKRYPNVNLIYRESRSSAQGVALHKCEIDVGFLRQADTPADVVSALLFKQPLVVVLPKTHSLSSCKKVKLAQLADETLFLFPRKDGRGWHDRVLAMYRNAGIKPRVVHTTLSPQFIVSMHVASGKGIYIHTATPTMLNNDLIAVRLDEPDATREVHIAWRKRERSPHILRFVDTARSVLSPKVTPKTNILRA